MCKWSNYMTFYCRPSPAWADHSDSAPFGERDVIRAIELCPLARARFVAATTAAAASRQANTTQRSVDRLVLKPFVAAAESRYHCATIDEPIPYFLAFVHSGHCGTWFSMRRDGDSNGTLEPARVVRRSEHGGTVLDGLAFTWCNGLIDSIENVVRRFSTTGMVVDLSHASRARREEFLGPGRLEAVVSACAGEGVEVGGMEREDFRTWRCVKRN